MSSPAHFIKKRKPAGTPATYGDYNGCHFYTCIDLDICTNSNDNRDSKRPQATERDHGARS